MTNMTIGTPDFIIAATILLSILMGIMRGLVKESISLISWALAIILSVLYAADLAAYMTFTKEGFIRNVASFLCIFVTIVFIGAIINYMVGSLVRQTPFSIPDRVLGSAFGFLRGIAFISLLVLLAGLTPLPEAKWWQQSYTIAKFQGIAVWLKDRLPDDIAKVFRLEEVEPMLSQESFLEEG